MPNSSLTPGKTNPALTKDIICSPSFRTGPYRNVPLSEKKRIAKSYGLDYMATRSLLEYDHLVSLELGGANDDANIWPEFLHINEDGFDVGAKIKDIEENKLHRLVCEDKISLEEAVMDVETNWVKAYQRDIGPLPTYKK